MSSFDYIQLRNTLSDYINRLERSSFKLIYIAFKQNDNAIFYLKQFKMQHISILHKFLCVFSLVNNKRYPLISIFWHIQIQRFTGTLHTEIKL